MFVYLFILAHTSSHTYIHTHTHISSQAFLLTFPHTLFLMCVAPHIPHRLSHRDIGDLQKNGLPWDWVEVTDPATGATSYRSDHANCTQPQKPDRPAVSPPPHTSHSFWNMHTHNTHNTCSTQHNLSDRARLGHSPHTRSFRKGGSPAGTRARGSSTSRTSTFRRPRGTRRRSEHPWSEPQSRPRMS